MSLHGRQSENEQTQPLPRFPRAAPPTTPVWLPPSEPAAYRPWPPPASPGSWSGGGWSGGGWQPPGPPPPPPRGRSGLIAVLAAVLVVCLIAFAGSLALLVQRRSPVATASPAPAGAGPASPAVSPLASPNPPGGPVLSTSAIAAAVGPGIVDINANLGSQGSAAGTGMILSTTGEVLTNNHVVAGAVSLEVEVAGSGHAYRGTVVGRDVAQDIAVVQMQGASGLHTIPLGDSSRVRVGDAVLALGNALGLAGPPSLAPGTVVGLNQSITASDPSAGTSENLTGLIQTDARLQPGDSGGPLVNDRGQVIGMDTAASARVRFTAGGGFAIPINKAVAVAAALYSGRGSATAPALLPGVLGVTISGAFASDGTPVGAAVHAVTSGGPAQGAGIRAGDIIVSLDGLAVDSPDALTGILAGHNAGDSVRVGWLDERGAPHTATVRLAPKTSG